MKRKTRRIKANKLTLDKRVIKQLTNPQLRHADGAHACGGISFYELFDTGFDLTLSGDWWSGTDQDVSGLGFELGHDLGPNVDLALGSYYSLYKYDLFLVSERDDVRTWFIAARWQRTSNRTLEVRYDYEDADFDTFQTVRVEAAWRF